MVTLIGLNYFGIKHVKSIEILSRILKDRAVRKSTLLTAKVKGSTKCCCATLNNNWLSFNELGYFRVMDEFKCK